MSTRTGTVSAPTTGRGVTARQVVAIALAVVAVVFIAQNRGDTSIAFLGVTLTMPLWLVLTLVTLVGVAVGFLLGRRRR